MLIVEMIMFNMLSAKSIFMLIMNRPAVLVSLFIEFSEQTHFTGWALRMINMQALRIQNQLNCIIEAALWHVGKKKEMQKAKGHGFEEGDSVFLIAFMAYPSIHHLTLKM